jgi:hypothetical protein
MARLQDEIADTFVEKLAESSDVTPQMIDALRALLAQNKKVKADDLVNVFSPTAGGDLK